MLVLFTRSLACCRTKWFRRTIVLGRFVNLRSEERGEPWHKFTSALCFEDSLDPKNVARAENVDIAETADQFEETIR